jgi:hypothetical protein
VDWDERLAGKKAGQRAGLLETLAKKETNGLAVKVSSRKRILRKKDKSR